MTDSLISFRPPPMPWARFEDGQRLGWTASWRLWKSWLLPYRTAEWLGYDEDTLEMNLGPWQWRRPDILRGLYRRDNPKGASNG